MRPDRASARPADLPSLDDRLDRLDRLDRIDRIDRIDRLLPQTQCRRCGYRGCRPYAEAIAAQDAPINRCPPGGSRTIEELARLLEVAPIALDQNCGEEQPRRTAKVDNTHCIGCTKCILACPVDAIVGAPGHQHHVLADRCTGCELCLPPCPADCIIMTAVGQAWSPADAARGRAHHQARLAREEAGAVPPVPLAAASRDPLVALAAPAERSRRLTQVIERARNTSRR